MSQILQGVRVLEVAMWTYVPVSGAVLAEWGADVIKVEHPDTGDPQRGLITSGLIPGGPDAIDYMVELPNRGKRSIGLNLRSPEGREILLKLAETADVFVTSFLPAARRKLGIDVDDIRAVNPSIIYVRGSGQGQRGPESERGGYDGCSYWARGGIGDAVTPPDAEYPTPMPIPAFGDVTGGLTLAGGIAAALYRRERTGEGSIVDGSLLSQAMWSAAASVMASEQFGIERNPKIPHDELQNPISNTYRTADRRYITLVMLESDRYWADFVTKAGRPDLATDPDYADSGLRAKNRKACIAELDELFAGRTLEQWREVMADVEGVWAAVQNTADLLTDQQALANGYLAQVEDRNGRSFSMVRAPLQFDEQPAPLTRAPDHGEHTDELLAELGLDDDAALELKIKGAVL